MTDPDFCIRFLDMAIHGLADRYVVAKLRRVTSPPVRVNPVSDTMANALGRLADIIRLGTESRNFTDLKAMEAYLFDTWGTTADEEWQRYVEVIRKALGVERLEPICSEPRQQPDGEQPQTLNVAFLDGEINQRPYIVGRIGEIMGSPAPTLLTWPNERESALARLGDVFRIGLAGQAFRDFVEQGRQMAKHEDAIVTAWNDCELAVRRARQQAHPSLVTLDQLTVRYLPDEGGKLIRD